MERLTFTDKEIVELHEIIEYAIKEVGVCASFYSEYIHHDGNVEDLANHPNAARWVWDFIIEDCSQGMVYIDSTVLKKILMRTTQTAYSYAVLMKESRWLEAEKVIAESSVYWSEYTKNFPEAAYSIGVAI